jgi:hypothetical protein
MAQALVNEFLPLSACHRPGGDNFKLPLRACSS